MTDQQILLVQQSFAAFAPDAEIVADIFYNRLFTLDEGLQLMFPADLSGQKRKLMTTLGFAVGTLRKTEVLIPALENLGRKHLGYGVRDEHYQIVGEALIETLREYFGNRFNLETEAAWAVMFALLAGTMQRAAREVQNTPNNSFNTEQFSKGEKTMTTAIKNISMMATMIFCSLFFASAANAATFTVTNTSDAGGNVCAAGNCSLRQAISAANQDVTVDTINFNIPGGGVKTITFSGLQLPTIVTQMTIDGTTQPGYSGSPLIELNGNNSTNYGLLIYFSSTVRGLAINRFIIDGIVVENNAPLPNVLVTLAGSQSKTALTDASGNYSFANLPSGGNYLVTPTLSGHNFEPFNLSYNNLAANVANANFVSTTGTPARLLRVAGGDTVSGNSVVVPIEIVSQGNENSVGFSLDYDANLLSNAQVSLGTDAAAGSLIFNSQTGKIGVLVALSAGQTFTAGTRQVATVTFLTAQTALYSTPVGFGDAPIGRETTDANAGVLPTGYADGAVTFAQGYESDVAPRPTGSGNGSVTVADFTQVGKFVAGTNLMDAGYNEFQRADSAPRGTKGNGFLTVSDYTQAGRYAAGLDAVQTAGGASTANLVGEDYEKNVKSKIENLTVPRNIHVVNAQALPNSQVLVSIEIDAGGDENAFGLTLNYDAAKLSNPLVALGSGTIGATLIPNTNNAGKVGLVLAFPVSQTIQAGTKQLVTIRFDVAANAPGGQTPLMFSDAPVFREVVNANADPLSTTFTDGAVNILGPTAANVTVGGRIVDAGGNAISRVSVSLTDGNGTTRTAVSNSFGNYLFTDVAAGASCVISVNSKRYQFSPNTQILAVTDDLESVNFTAEN